ncbi:MAG: HD domain-containing protein [Thermoleophilia bacterium]|nr:HD domain-containing protein [Thermoleophilia bacterium]
MNDDQLDLGASFESRPATAGGPERVGVRDLRPGTTVEGIYLLSAKETRNTKAGKPFYKLKVSDRTGTVDCTVWELAAMESDLKPGDLVMVAARVSEYQGKPQLEASSVAIAPSGAAEATDFLPSTYRDVEELKGFLQFHIDSVRDRDYGALLHAFFSNPEFYRAFTTAPAAKVYHHAYLGGLMEHTVAVVDLCDFVGQQYGRIDRDLLVTAALLHDAGKTRELAFETAIDFTDAGRFLGHVIQGVILVSEKAREVPSFPEEKLQQLLHCVVSHHGELEWGSPKRPKTIEALVLHHVDNLDAKVKGFLEIVEGSRDAPWTDLRNLFRRPLHVPRAAHQEQDFLPPGEDDPPGYA